LVAAITVAGAGGKFSPPLNRASFLRCYTPNKLCQKRRFELRDRTKSFHSFEIDIMRSLFIAVAVIGSTLASPALAAWWIVRSSDEKCLVVDVEPKGAEKGVTKIGKDAYQTVEEAEADVKRLCEEAKSKSKNDSKDNQ
jgi:hypothetical protein